MLAQSVLPVLSGGTFLWKKDTDYSKIMCMMFYSGLAALDWAAMIICTFRVLDKYIDIYQKLPELLHQKKIGILQVG